MRRHARKIGSHPFCLRLRQHHILSTLLVLLLCGCDPTRRVADGQYLLKRNRVVFSEASADPADVASIIKQKPNKRILGVPIYLGIYNQSDATFFPTILDTLDSLGKLIPVGEEGHIVQVSVDASPMAMTAIRDGWLDAAIAQPMTDYIDYGVDYLIRAINGETFEPGETDHGSVIEERNGNLVDLLPTPVVTIDNVEDPELWGNKDFALEAFGAQ